MAKKQIKLVPDLSCSLPLEFIDFLYALSLKDYPHPSIRITILNRCKKEGWDGDYNTLRDFFSKRIKDPFKDKLGDIIMGLMPEYKNYNHEKFLKKIKSIEKDLKIVENTEKDLKVAS